MEVAVSMPRRALGSFTPTILPTTSIPPEGGSFNAPKGIRLFYTKLLKSLTRRDTGQPVSMPRRALGSFTRGVARHDRGVCH